MLSVALVPPGGRPHTRSQWTKLYHWSATIMEIQDLPFIIKCSLLSSSSLNSGWLDGKTINATRLQVHSSILSFITVVNGKIRFESIATLYQSHFLRGSARRKKHERLMDSQGCGKTVKSNPSTNNVITHIVQVFGVCEDTFESCRYCPALHWWTAYLRPESKNSDVEWMESYFMFSVCAGRHPSTACFSI